MFLYSQSFLTKEFCVFSLACTELWSITVLSRTCRTGGAHLCNEQFVFTELHNAFRYHFEGS